MIDRNNNLFAHKSSEESPLVITTDQPSPQPFVLPDGVIDAFIAKTAPKTTYTIDDYETNYGPQNDTHLLTPRSIEQLDIASREFDKAGMIAPIDHDILLSSFREILDRLTVRTPSDSIDRLQPQRSEASIQASFVSIYAWIIANAEHEHGTVISADTPPTLDAGSHSFIHNTRQHINDYTFRLTELAKQKGMILAPIIEGSHSGDVELAHATMMTMLVGKKTYTDRVRSSLLTTRQTLVGRAVDKDALEQAITLYDQVVTDMTMTEDDFDEAMRLRYRTGIGRAASIIMIDKTIAVLEASKADPELAKNLCLNYLEQITHPDIWRDIVSKWSAKSCEQLGMQPTPEEPTVEAAQTPFELQLPTMQVDFKVLDTGRLSDKAREIVTRASARESRELTIDLERLTILENIRQWWGPDRSYYAEGIYDETDIVTDDDGQEFVDQYIMLVLQELDTNGGVACEHVIADSPIAGPNGLYVQRYDVNGWTWREMMRLKKPDARAMGARSLRHEAPVGDDLNDNMTQKIQHLLTCRPGEFADTNFNGSRNGEIITRQRRSRKAGSAAMRATQSS